MIHEALTFIQNQLNEYFRNRFGLSEEVVVISNIVNQDGTSAIKDENKVILSLVGMEEERMISQGQKQFNSGGSGYSGTNPPIIMNLFLLFSTSFSGQMVKESLKFISVIIGFFQSNSVFTSDKYSDLKNEKLIFEMFNLNFLEQNNLWASMGAKYVPSILYRVRMVVIEEGLIHFEIPEIGKVDDDRKQPGEGLPLDQPPINPLSDKLKDATDSVRKLADQGEDNKKATTQSETPQSNLLNEDQFDDFMKDK